VREVDAMDRRAGRNRLRILADDHGSVHIETYGNHDGTSVCTAITLDRTRFVALVRELGVL